MNKKITVFCLLLLTVCLSVTVLSVRGPKTPSNLSTATAGVHYADSDGDGFDDDAFDFNIDDIFTTRAPSGSTTKNNVQESVSNAAGELASEVGGKVTQKQEEISKGAGSVIGAVSNFFGDEALGNMGDNFSHYVSEFRGNIGSGSSSGSSSGGLFGGLLDRIRNIGGGNNSTPTYEPSVYTPITPVVTRSSNGGSSYNNLNNNVTSPAPATPATPAAPAAESGDPVNFSSNVNPYTKPAGSFRPGDEDETIKWLQWIFVYTGSLPSTGVNGKLDDNTVAAVKTLQRKYGLTVDGAITPEVVKAAEQDFYAAVGGLSTVPAESATEPVSEQEPAPGDYHNNVGVIVLIICIAVIWCVAAGAIVFILLYKKKKKAAAPAAKPADKPADKPAAPADASAAAPAESGNMSLSDLFAEAGTKNEPKA